MIVLDAEFSGLDSGKCGIWQIGAYNMKTKDQFLEEARIDNEDEISSEALIVIGKTEEDLRNKNKQSQKQLIENFLNWLNKFDERILAGQNVGIDLSFIQNKCIRYGLHEKFRQIASQRSIDLHTVASLEYKKQNKRFKIENGKSAMNLLSILEFCKMKDPRMQLEMGKIVKHGNSHNALEDAKLTAACFEKLNLK